MTKLARTMVLSDNGMVPHSRSKYEISSRGVSGPQENEEQNTTKKETTKNVGPPRVSDLSTPLPLHKNKKFNGFWMRAWGPSWLGHLHVDSKGTFHEDKIVIVY